MNNDKFSRPLIILLVFSILINTITLGAMIFYGKKFSSATADAEKGSSVSVDSDTEFVTSNALLRERLDVAMSEYVDKKIDPLTTKDIVVSDLDINNDLVQVTVSFVPKYAFSEADIAVFAIDQDGTNYEAEQMNLDAHSVTAELSLPIAGQEYNYYAVVMDENQNPVTTCLTKYEFYQACNMEELIMPQVSDGLYIEYECVGDTEYRFTAVLNTSEFSFSKLYAGCTLYLDEEEYNTLELTSSPDEDGNHFAALSFAPISKDELKEKSVTFIWHISDDCGRSFRRHNSCSYSLENGELVEYYSDIVWDDEY